MSFFYSTPAGMWDFYIFAGVTLFSVLCGATNTKRLAAITIAVFLLDRAALLLDSKTLSVIAILGCVSAVYAITKIADGISAKGIAALYFLKLLAWSALVVGLIGFDMLATIATVLVYLQLFILLGGAIDGLSGGRLSGVYRHVPDRASGGLFRGLAAVESGRAISPHPGMPQQRMATNQNLETENRRTE